jgi:uncharacterized OB-fold protein
VTEQTVPYGDALTRPFWAAAQEHRLILQHCPKCGSYQFYPRPFCLDCQSGELEWSEASGRGTVYSATTVRMNVLPDLEPPYQVAIVELAEGPRMLGGIVGDKARIGDAVEIRWREREDLPPLPMFAIQGGSE